MTNKVHPRETVVISGAHPPQWDARWRASSDNRARIGLIARGHDGLEAARHEIEADGGEAMTIIADVSQPEQLEHAATVVEEKFGPIDIWINNAMVSVFSPVTPVAASLFAR